MTLEGPEKEANLENIEQKERQCQDGDEKAGVWLLTGSEKRRKTGSAKRKGEMETVDGTFLSWQRHKHGNISRRPMAMER